MKKHINKRVLPKKHKKWWTEDIKGTIIGVDTDLDLNTKAFHIKSEYDTEYLVEWDKPVQGNDIRYYKEGWYLLNELILLDRKLKLERILK